MAHLKFKVSNKVGTQKFIYCNNKNNQLPWNIARIKLKPIRKGNHGRLVWKLYFSKKKQWLGAIEGTGIDTSKIQEVVVKLFRQYYWNNVVDGSTVMITVPASGNLVSFTPEKF